MGLFSRKFDHDRQTTDAKRPRYGVLLVDDEILNLTTLAGLLEDEYRVVTATSAQEALRIIADADASRDIQVIISDQRMPGMTGVEFLGRALQLRPCIKRILLTGYTDVEAIIGAINDAAVYKYIRKPVDSLELRLTLTRALEAWQLEQDHDALLEEQRLTLERLSLLDADKLEFLRYLAHEMNTPLNWLSATQVVDREQVSAEVQEILGFVDQGQERLRNLVSAVLRYFQLAGLRQPPSRGRVDLPVLLGQKVEDCSSRAAHVRFSVQQPETLTIDSDPSLLGEALEHLLENAATHSGRHAEPAVTIEVESLEKGVRIHIHNSGPGLAPEAIGQLLRPFRFGSDHGDEGFGISLATVKAVALILGGDLSASCEGPGKGVRLSLDLPYALVPVR